MSDEGSAAPPVHVVEALYRVYTDEGVAIWIKWWQGSSDEARRQGELRVLLADEGNAS